MTYELWDLRNRNSLRTFTSRPEAFEAVRSITHEQPELVPDLEVDGEDADGEQVLKVTGQELAELAEYREYA
ncbi:MAG: hypothetical protein JF887_13060 [Candidatus Dormibacteraeota bacterium]|uniref:Uncharacterized protein n=1 Tax=Candidatus Amunia macphersoniae TaxID=3127014 RepID=A0A934NAN0_9BACT|nr:hypothetical protein [Candidatus Dormibacteraeota bacterium]